MSNSCLHRPEKAIYRLGQQFDPSSLVTTHFGFSTTIAAEIYLRMSRVWNKLSQPSTAMIHSILDHIRTRNLDGVQDDFSEGK